jgi:hypothetical protein
MKTEDSVYEEVNLCNTCSDTSNISKQQSFQKTTSPAGEINFLRVFTLSQLVADDSVPGIRRRVTE